MKAKEFDIKFWQENNPLTTPLWKCAEAYHKAEIDKLEKGVTDDNGVKSIIKKYKDGKELFNVKLNN